MSDVLIAIRREMVAAEYLDKAVVQIRVTAHAVPGSIACLPMMRVEPRPRELLEVLNHPDDWREVLIHPDDWRELLRTMKWRDCTGDDVLYVMGLPVVRGLGA